MSRMRSKWELEHALLLIRVLEFQLRLVGFTCALGGSVLHEGWSDSDLDLVIFPMAAITGRRKYDGLYAKLQELGWTRIVDVAQVRVAWQKKGSYDAKHVEIWNDPEGRRIDLFLLQ